jgi:hypothetical protein
MIPTVEQENINKGKNRKGQLAKKCFETIIIKLFLKTISVQWGFEFRVSRAE